MKWNKTRSQSLQMAYFNTYSTAVSVKIYNLMIIMWLSWNQNKQSNQITKQWCLLQSSIQYFKLMYTFTEDLTYASCSFRVTTLLTIPDHPAALDTFCKQYFFYMTTLYVCVFKLQDNERRGKKSSLGLMRISKPKRFSSPYHDDVVWLQLELK